MVERPAAVTSKTIKFPTPIAEIGNLRDTAEVQRQADKFVNFVTIESEDCLHIVSLAAFALESTISPRRALKEFGKRTIEGLNQFFLTVPYTFKYLFPPDLSTEEAISTLNISAEIMSDTARQLERSNRSTGFSPELLSLIQNYDKSFRSIPYTQLKYTTMFLLSQDASKSTREIEIYQKDINDNLLTPVHQLHTGTQIMEQRKNLGAAFFEFANKYQGQYFGAGSELKSTEFGGISYGQIQQNENSEKNFLEIVDYLSSIPKGNVIWQRFAEGAFLDYYGDISQSNAIDSQDISKEGWDAAAKSSEFILWLSDKIFKPAFSSDAQDQSFDDQFKSMISNLDGMAQEGMAMGIYAAISHSFYVNAGIELGQKVDLSFLSKMILDSSPSSEINKFKDSMAEIGNIELVEKFYEANWPNIKNHLISRFGEQNWIDSFDEIVAGGIKRKAAINFFTVDDDKKEIIILLNGIVEDMALLGAKIIELEHHQNPDTNKKIEPISSGMQINLNSLSYKLGFRYFEFQTEIDNPNILVTQFTTDDPKIKFELIFATDGGIIRQVPAIYRDIPGATGIMMMEAIGLYYQKIKSPNDPKKNFSDAISTALSALAEENPDLQIVKDSEQFLTFFGNENTPLDQGQLNKTEKNLPIKKIPTELANKLLSKLFND